MNRKFKFEFVNETDHDLDCGIEHHDLAESISPIKHQNYFINELLKDFISYSNKNQGQKITNYDEEKKEDDVS